MEFDASIDLVAHQLPEGLPPPEATRRARAAVEALPGAGWISVEWCGHFPVAAAGWVRVYWRGRGEVMEGRSWRDLQAVIGAEVAAALAR
jgi:hypothetical protein